MRPQSADVTDKYRPAAYGYETTNDQGARSLQQNEKRLL